ncbi:hypothetical protein Tco_0375003 [Tanacetum coccineum]
MENANPFILALSNGLHARITHKLNVLRAISAMIDSRLENIDHTRITIPPTTPFDQLLNDFMNPHDVFEIDDLESYDESVDTPLVFSPSLGFDDELEGWSKLYLVRSARKFLGFSHGQFLNDDLARCLRQSGGAFGKHLGEILTLWTQFGKKQDKIATLLEDTQILFTDHGDGVTISCDDVKAFKGRRQDSY